MYSAQIENSSGELLTLTNNETEWTVLSITGLNPTNATINTTKLAGHDGAQYNSASLNTRNIVIQIALRGDVEKNRLLLYSMFPIKSDCTFYYQNGRRNVKIDGYIENIEVNLFSMTETMQISMICPDPYFQNVNPSFSDISKNAGATQFPIEFNPTIEFSIYDSDRIAVVENVGDDTGFLLTVEMLSTANIPPAVVATGFTIANEDTDEFMTINYSFADKSKIVIDTRQGQKSITLYVGATVKSLLGYMAEGSTFLQLRHGKNRFSYTPVIATAKIDYNLKFGGV